jgi:hypothetical protein
MGRGRLWLESVTALVALFLAVLTLLIPDWLEAVAGLDIDGHSGTAEWLAAGLLAATALALGEHAALGWRRLSGRRRLPVQHS